MYFLKKIHTYYRSAAEYFIDTVVIIVALNVICAIALHYLFVVNPFRNVIALQEVYPGKSPAKIAEILQDTYDKPWEYEAWVGHKEKKRATQNVNVVADGFRKSYEDNTALDLNAKSVFMFGGSTMFGYGLSDYETIPAHLHTALRGKTDGPPINVYNFGRAYYNLYQESVLLEQLLLSGKTPTVAVFMDGLNEVRVEPHYTRELKSLFLSFNGNGGELVRNIFLHLPIFQIAKLGADYFSPPPQNYMPTSEVLVNRYVFAKEKIKRLADQYGFKIYFAIQPIPGYKNEFWNHKFTQQNLSEEYYTWKMQLMTDLEATASDARSFSIADALADYDKQPFIDKAHYTDEVHQILADAIAEKITPSLTASP